MIFELSEIHNCKECQNKIVSITLDKLGVTRCAYCGEIVDYSDYFKYKEAKKQIEELNKNE